MYFLMEQVMQVHLFLQLLPELLWQEVLLLLLVPPLQEVLPLLEQLFLAVPLEEAQV